MKKILTTLFVSIGLSCLSQDMFYNDQLPWSEHSKIELQLNQMKKQTKYSGVTISPTLGLGMIGGGAMFILAGALTSPTYVGGSTTILKPWYEQPGFYPIASGAILVTAGIIISLNY